jgi:hypothetical protein
MRATTNNSIGFSSLLGLTFIILKLTAVIDWDWLWVLAPFWIPVGVVLLAIVGIVLITLLTDTPIKVTKRNR